jgi:hypothetical protein
MAIMLAKDNDPTTGEERYAYGVNASIAATKILLDFNKTRPATKADVSVSGAEGWLAALAAAEKLGG